MFENSPRKISQQKVITEIATLNIEEVALRKVARATLRRGCRTPLPTFIVKILRILDLF
jgi:hypothetical protein